MKLINLKVSGIRGFNVNQEFELDDNLIVIYGPNGQGKTSFAEVIEYLFFGTIYKKENACSKVEFKDTIKNIHFAGTPFVEAIIKINSDNKIVRREYISETDSKIIIDGIEVENLDSITTSLDLKPIIYQHGLQSFINTPPVDRYNQFMKLLGIEKLDNFLKITIKNLNNFKTNKPTQIRESLIFCQEIQEKFNNIFCEATSNKKSKIEIANLINKRIKNSDFEIILEDNFNDFLKSSIQLIENEKKSIFDTNKLIKTIEFQKTSEQPLFEKESFQTILNFLTNPTNISTSNEITILEKGLTMLDNEIEICPLCQEKTINAQKKEEIKDILNKLNTTKQQLTTHSASLEKIKQIINNKKQYIDSLKELIISKETLEKLQIFQLDLTKIISTNNLLNETFKSIINKYEEIKQLIDSIKPGEKPPEDINSINEKNDEFIKFVDTYQTTIETVFKPLISQLKKDLDLKISSQKGIDEKELLMKTLIHFKHFKIYNLNQEIESEFSENIAKLKEFRDSKLSELINIHKAKIIEWYDLLNPDEEIRISDIECNGNKINFIASCFGVNKPAVPILSEAHLNCLGLSIYLSQIIDCDNPFSFILIDDPVQSMDDAHTNNFISNVLEKLLNKDIQIYVMSHLKPAVSDLIITRYQHKLPKYIEFYGFCLEGPKFIVKASNRFEDYINQAKETYNGSSEQRKTCANMIRQAVETYTKLYYEKKSGNSIPADCKKAQFSILDNKLLTRVEIESNEKGKLRMISGKCDKRSHDDELTEIPTSGELNSFIDTLNGLYKKHLK
ncbi:hypothetical protein KO361_02115 [Candidatus Woesearchaeota archaeon]|nr:hypothetical protein [Candidatus Woesearchaeota archaeon]